MNNIYKVIWSKAKNCYVVASEIARSHTKSASGSEKIGGVTRRKLLASLMALSLLCGGLGVAEASVHVVESGETYEVLTKQEVKDGYGTKDDVKSNKYNIEKLQTTTTQQGTQIAINTTNIATNKANISALQTTATEQGKLIETNTANIANNTTAIEKKINAETANERFATKDALNNLERVVTDKVDENTFESALDLKADTDLGNLTEEGKTAIKNTMLEDMNLKADKTYVDAEVGKKADKATTLDGYGINDAYTKTDADRKFATSDALNTAKTDLEGKIAANTTKIDANKTDIDGLKTKAATTETTLTDLSGRMTTAESTITDLKDTDVRLEGKIGQNANDITGLKDKDVELSGNIGANKTAIDQNKTGITQNKNDITTINGKLTTAEGSIAANKNAIDDLKTKVGTVNNGTYLDSSKPVGENLNKLNDGLVKEVEDRKAADTALSGRIDANANTIAKVNHELENTNNHFNTELGKTNAALQEEGKVRANADAALASDITATNKRTAGIKRDDVRNETTIEGNVTVDSLGNVTAKGQLTGKGVDAGDGTITTKGAVNAGSLTVEKASNLKGDVTMDKKLSVTGDTLLKKTDVDGALNVTGESSLKNTTVGGTLGVTGETTLSGELKAEEDATFGKDVTVKGTTNLGNTTVTGDLKVTGTITTDKMVFGDPATGNYTEINKGNITSKNAAVAGDATLKSSSMELDHTKLEVGVADKDSKGHLTMTADQTSIKNSDLAGKNYSEIVADKDSVKTTVKDEKGNTTSTKSSATEIRNYAGDAAGNKTNNVQTATQNKSWAKDKDGNESSIVQTGKDITNTAQNGTITNDAKDIVNNATTMKTTVTGQATESYGKLDTTVNGAENHTVNGQQTNTVGGGQINNITGGQTNNILTGDQKTTVSDGSIINKAEHGDISNTAKNVTNEGTESVTNKVGTNEVKVSKDGVDIKVDADKTIKESVGAVTSRTMTDGNIIDQAGDMTVTTDKTTGTTFGNGTPKDTTVINGGTIGTNKVNANETNTKKLTAGAAADANGGRLTVDANDGVKGSYKYGDYTSRSYILANTLMSGVDNGKKPTDADFVGSRTDHYMDGDKAKLDETVKDAAGSNVTNKTSTGTVTTITDGTTTTTTEQGVKDITNTATGGTIKNDAKDIVNNAQDTITNQVKDSKVTTDANGTTFENKTAAVSDGGTTMTKINGNRINTGRVDANELGVSDKDGANTADLSVKAGEGVKASAGNGTTTGSLDVKGDKVESSVKDGDKTNTVTSTAGGTTFNNSKANTVFEGGTYTDTTIKGNTITTGKVTMDYADVMKDLGVRGNATINGKTTTGSLEVTGTSTLKGDVTMENNATVGNNLTVNGTTKTKTLNVTENAEVGGELKVAKKATFEDSVSIAKDLTVGGDVTAKSYKVGDKTYISADGINANDQKITNVADGSISEGSKDAVNGGQLYQVKNDLEGKVNKVGANAAAMANLHPMEFDPDSKWNIAAAMGNYGSETATAIGAFYRPNEDVMVNFSTAFGTGENMVGGGVSVRLGKGSNKLSREESNALKDQVNDLTARMDALLSVLNPNMSKDFPDVPENHWAYEAVSRLAGNDIVQGYPDGEFHGDRTMTRYEMAEIIYNALSRGAEAERELVEEFKPELQAMAASEKATAEKAEG